MSGVLLSDILDIPKLCALCGRFQVQYCKPVPTPTCPEFTPHVDILRRLVEEKEATNDR